MNELQIFNNDEFGTIRTAIVDGQPVFCLSDICKALDIKNVSEVKSRLDTAHLYTIYIGVVTGKKADGSDAIQQVPATFINEPNLYRTIFQSRKPEAQKFIDWIADEVLPSIRQTGSYSLQKPDSYAIEDPAERARRWAEEYEEKKALESQVAIKDQQISEMQPKASYFDVVINSPSLISTTAIAKDYGWSAQQLNKCLHNFGIQYKLGEIWLLYQKYAEQGYTNTKTHAHPAPDGSIHTSVHTYWTQKGRLFIYDRLKEHGILPLIERFNPLELPDYEFGGLA